MISADIYKGILIWQFCGAGSIQREAHYSILNSKLDLIFTSAQMFHCADNERVLFDDSIE